MYMLSCVINSVISFYIQEYLYLSLYILLCSYSTLGLLSRLCQWHFCRLKWMSCLFKIMLSWASWFFFIKNVYTFPFSSSLSVLLCKASSCWKGRQDLISQESHITWRAPVGCPPAPCQDMPSLSFGDILLTATSCRGRPDWFLPSLDTCVPQFPIQSSLFECTEKQTGPGGALAQQQWFLPAMSPAEQIPQPCAPRPVPVATLGFAEPQGSCWACCALGFWGKCRGGTAATLTPCLPKGKSFLLFLPFLSHEECSDLGVGDVLEDESSELTKTSNCSVCVVWLGFLLESGHSRDKLTFLLPVS